VALNGDGGDESFAGYERYQAMLLAQKLPNFAKQIISRFVKILPDSVEPKNKMRRIKRFFNAATLPAIERYTRWVGIFNDQIKKEIYSANFLKTTLDYKTNFYLGRFLAEAGNMPYLDCLLWMDIMTSLAGDLLVKMDIATMANSLEARAPFLDQRLMEFAAKLPPEFKMRNLVKKYILKKAIKDLVPDENVYRRKMGFALPVGRWFRGELKEFLCDNLLAGSFFKRGYFKPEAVKNMVKRHTENKEDFSHQLWTLLMLELWHRRFMDK